MSQLVINISQTFQSHFIAGSVSFLQLASNICMMWSSIFNNQDDESLRTVLSQDRNETGADQSWCGHGGAGTRDQCHRSVRRLSLVYFSYCSPAPGLGLVLQSQIRVVLILQTYFWTSASPQTDNVLLAHLTLTGIILCKYPTDNKIQQRVTVNEYFTYYDGIIMTGLNLWVMLEVWFYSRFKNCSVGQSIDEQQIP